MHAVPAGAGSAITALLGPTNTGKTHRAVERMLEHDTGMIGLPLRLLAREIYDRVSVRVGEGQVALVTGEEKRIPARPRYWVCTVEAMPVDRDVDFLAVDEIQLAAHPQRGHVFTARLLHARGLRETWLLGADTMRPLVGELLPTATLRRHPRLSRLRFAGDSSLTTLPPRSAVVAFSTPEVYALADRLRHRRGGAAVVLGALSPRTRNAQVAMYQAGEVQYLVATDAIGMGLNLGVDHVAFASLRKFDGRRARALDPPELGQIAGRAGRYLNDGTFGALRPARLPDDVTHRIESHEFAPVRRLVWRNHDLDFGSVDALLGSLHVRPVRGVLRMVERADDTTALTLLAARPEVRGRAHGAERVRLLWDVCQIPDFRKLMPEHHAALLTEVFAQLTGPRGRIDPDLMDARIGGLDSLDGDIDTLMMRMEFIRTWSYITHHAGWLDDAAHWQARAQQTEDRLGDALHARLIERFVERGRGPRRSGRGPSRGARRPRVELAEGPPGDGPFAMLRTLRLGPLAPSASDERLRIDDLVDAPHERFSIDGRGRILDGATPLARLTRGPDLLHPGVKLTLEQPLPAGQHRQLLRRLGAFAQDLVARLLDPLRSPAAGALSPAGRGLIYQLERSLGAATARQARAQLDELGPGDHRVLDGLGVRLDGRILYVEALLEPESLRVRAALSAAFFEPRGGVRLSPTEAASFPLDRSLPGPAYLALGFAVLGPRAVRIDVAEGLRREIRAAGPDHPPAAGALAVRLGCSEPEAEAVVRALGARLAVGSRRPRRRRRRRHPRHGPEHRDGSSAPEGNEPGNGE